MALIGLPQFATLMPQQAQQPVQDVASASPFTWGAGGVAMTPEDLARRRAVAQSLMKSNYSPISSVWQGLGRVADNVLGAVDDRDLDKQAAAATARSNAVAQALIAPGGSAGNVAAQAMIDPYVSPEVQGLAGKVWDRANPKPTENETQQKYDFIAGKLGPEAANNYLRTIGDPLVNMSLGPDRFISGPRSMIPQLLGGQQGGAGQPPATLPPDFDFGAGGPTQPASAGFHVPSGNPLEPYPGP